MYVQTHLSPEWHAAYAGKPTEAFWVNTEHRYQLCQREGVGGLRRMGDGGHCTLMRGGRVCPGSAPPPRSAPVTRAGGGGASDRGRGLRRPWRSAVAGMWPVHKDTPPHTSPGSCPASLSHWLTYSAPHTQCVTGGPDSVTVTIYTSE